MPWIRAISDEDAEGPLKQIFEAAYKRAGRVFNIVRIMSLNPATLRSSLGLYQSSMMGPSPLSRAMRELLATVVSRVNNCFY